jgi:hypothetical protein
VGWHLGGPFPDGGFIIIDVEAYWFLRGVFIVIIALNNRIFVF